LADWDDVFDVNLRGVAYGCSSDRPLVVLDVDAAKRIIRCAALALGLRAVLRTILRPLLELPLTLFTRLELLFKLVFRLFRVVGTLLLIDELLLCTLFLFERKLLLLPGTFRFERLSLERWLHAKRIASSGAKHDKHESADHQTLGSNLRLLDSSDRRELLLVLEHPLLLRCAGLGLLLQLHTELRFIGFTNAALFLVTLRALVGQAGVFFGTHTGFLCFAPLFCRGFVPSPRVLGRLEPRLFLGRDARLLKGAQLQELVRE